MNLSNFNMLDFLMSMSALVVCITIHEFAHAYSAYRAGDDTPRAQGRLSLNPIDHLDPIGTIMMIMSSISGFGIGWGKPVQINPYNFKHPRWDNLRVSLWGPLSNILTAVVVGIALRLTVTYLPPNAALFMFYLALISIGLAVFNLIPISPLDGSHILSSLLPHEHARQYDMIMSRYGALIFLGLIFLAPEVLHAIIGPPRVLLVNAVLGDKVLMYLIIHGLI